MTRPVFRRVPEPVMPAPRPRSPGMLTAWRAG